MKKINRLACLFILTSLAVTVLPQSGGTFVVTKSVVGNSGGLATGDNFALDSTAGEAVAGTTSSGDGYGLSSGYGADPVVTAPGVAINGTVTYGNAVSGSPPPRFVSNVTVASSSGSPAVSTITGPPGPNAGTYSLTGFGAGAYTITPTKTTGVNSITSFDAARIAQHVAGLNTLIGNARVAADVSGNNTINSFDAGLIARYVVSAPPFGNAGQWRFYTVPNVPFPVGTTPTSRTYPSVTTNLSGEDYTGLLIGEVSGNWTNTGSRPVGVRESLDNRSLGARRDPHIELPSIVTPIGNEITIPMIVQGVANRHVIAYEFELRYDPTVIQPAGDVAEVKGTVSHGLSLVTNASEPGLLRVAAYGAIPIDLDGVLLNLTFISIGTNGSTSPLILQRIVFNEDTPSFSTVGGQVTVGEDGR